MRVARKDPLVRPFMWQQILIQAAWQCLVLTILMFFGGMMLFPAGERPNLVTTPLRDERLQGTNRLILDTFVFHVFILMSLFNTVNCKVISPGEVNVFHTLLQNWAFVIVLAAELCLQQWMVNCGRQTLTIQAALLGTGKLTSGMNAAAWVLGALTLVVGVVAKKAPVKHFAFTKAWSLEGENTVRNVIADTLHCEWLKEGPEDAPAADHFKPHD